MGRQVTIQNLTGEIIRDRKVTFGNEHVKLGEDRHVTLGRTVR